MSFVNSSHRHESSTTHRCFWEPQVFFEGGHEDELSKLVRVQSVFLSCCRVSCPRKEPFRGHRRDYSWEIVQGNLVQIRIFTPNGLPNNVGCALPVCNGQGVCVACPVIVSPVGRALPVGPRFHRQLTLQRAMFSVVSADDRSLPCSAIASCLFLAINF